MFQMAIQPKLMEIRHLDAEGTFFFSFCVLNLWLLTLMLWVRTGPLYQCALLFVKWHLNWGTALDETKTEAPCQSRCCVIKRGCRCRAKVIEI